MANNVKRAWTNEERLDMVMYIKDEFGYTNKKAGEVVKLMEKLAINVDEAIELAEFDKKPTDIANEEVVSEKEKKEVKKITAQAKKELKEKKKVAKAKADEVKTIVCENMLELLTNTQINLQQVKNGKICFQGTDGAFYTLTLTKNKACPDGYT